MLQDINLLVEFLESIFITIVFELASLPPARVLTFGTATIFLLDAETAEAFEAPSALVINESIEELAPLNHCTF